MDSMQDATIIRGQIVNSGKDPILNGAVVIQKDRILAVGKYEEIKQDYDTSDIIGDDTTIVSPGFVNTHSHAVQTLLRGAADDRDLIDWLEEIILPGEATMTAEEVYASCMIGFAEMLKSGITTTNDMLTANHSEAGFKAAEDIGIRARIGKMLMDRNVPDPMLGTTEEVIEEARQFADKYPAGGRIQYSFTPRFIPTCTDELMKLSSEEAARRGLMMHTHAAENEEETRMVTDMQGVSYIQALDELNCLGEHVILAHCIWVNDAEKQLLKDTGTNISHNPSSNCKLASGIAPVPDYLKLDIPIGLATDGSPATGSHNFFLEMKLSTFLQKATHRDPKTMKAATVHKMATEFGAASLNLSDVGKLQPGYKADLVVLKTEDPSSYPMYNPLSFLVYTATPSNVSEVFVDGNQVVQQGELVHDLTKEYDIAKQYANDKPFRYRMNK